MHTVMHLQAANKLPEDPPEGYASDHNGINCKDNFVHYGSMLGFVLPGVGMMQFAVMYAFISMLCCATGNIRLNTVWHETAE
jgi:hypothetical protein